MSGTVTSSVPPPLAGAVLRDAAGAGASAAGAARAGAGEGFGGAEGAAAAFGGGAALALAAAGASDTSAMIRSPSDSLSPTLTLMPRTTPACGAGTSIV